MPDDGPKPVGKVVGLVNRGLLRIQCSRCPAFLTAQHCSREEFAEGLEECGWRAIAKAARQVVCPNCAKKCKPEELATPKYVRATT